MYKNFKKVNRFFKCQIRHTKILVQAVSVVIDFLDFPVKIENFTHPIISDWYQQKRNNSEYRQINKSSWSFMILTLVQECMIQDLASLHQHVFEDSLERVWIYYLDTHFTFYHFAGPSFVFLSLLKVSEPQDWNNCYDAHSFHSVVWLIEDILNHTPFA